MKVFRSHNYRTFLKETLAERIARNPKYSLRAMARQLGMSPALLSQVLNGKRNLSSERAIGVASQLGLKARERNQFELLVQTEKIQDPEIKGALLRRAGLEPHEFQDLDLDYFRMVSDWHYFAILTLTELDSFDLTAGSASKRLGISRLEADLAIQRLTRLKMLAPDASGVLRKTHRNPRVSSAGADQSLRTFHLQTIRKAIESLETQTPDEKVIGSETFCIDFAQLSEYEQLCEDFFDRMLDLSRRSTRRNRVYHLGVQFFSFTPEGKTKAVAKRPASRRKENRPHTYQG